MVFEFKEISNLSVGFLRQSAANLNINALITAYRYKVYFFRFVFTDIDVIAFPAQYAFSNQFK